MENGSRLMLRPEHKSAAFRKEVVSQFSEPGDLDLDVSAERHFTAKPCLLLDHCRRLVRFQKQSDSVENAIRDLWKLFLGDV